MRTRGGKTSENRGANVSRTYSARRYGWHRLRSMRQENYEIREHAKNRDWKRATQLRLRQSLFQSQRMSPDFYFFQASFRSRLNHPHLRAEALSKRCSAVFYVHPAGSPHKHLFESIVFHNPLFTKLPAETNLRFSITLPFHPTFEIVHLRRALPIG